MTRRLSIATTLSVLLLRGAAANPEPAGELIERLKAEDYPDRVAAEEKLGQWALEHGKEAWPWLKEKAEGDLSPEVQERALTVLKASVLDELSQKRPGFVGITMAATKLELDEGGYGVQISMVSPNSPAQKAGLQPNDVIFELNGEGWDGVDAADSFAGRVGKMVPGTKVKLGLLRGGERMDVELRLAARPWSAGEYGDQRRLLLQRGNFLGPRGGFVMPEQDEEKARDAAFQKWMDAQREGDSED